MTQAWRRIDEDDRTGSSVRLVGSSSAEVVASLSGAGGIRTGETWRHGAVDQSTRGEAWDCFTRIGLGLLEKDREGGVFW